MQTFIRTVNIPKRASSNDPPPLHALQTPIRNHCRLRPKPHNGIANLVESSPPNHSQSGSSSLAEQANLLDCSYRPIGRSRFLFRDTPQVPTYQPQSRQYSFQHGEGSAQEIGLEPAAAGMVVGAGGTRWHGKVRRKHGIFSETRNPAPMDAERTTSLLREGVAPS